MKNFAEILKKVERINNLTESILSFSTIDDPTQIHISNPIFTSVFSDKELVPEIKNELMRFLETKKEFLEEELRKLMAKSV